MDNNCAYKEHEDKLAALLPHRDWADGELGEILQGIEYSRIFFCFCGWFLKDRCWICNARSTVNAILSDS